MSSQWRTYLLIFSMSLNVAGITAFLYASSQSMKAPNTSSENSRPALGELVTLLNLDKEQHEIFQNIFSTHRQHRQARHREIGLKRQELLSLLKNVNTSWPEFQAKLREIRDIQFKGEEASLRFFLEFHQHLKPEQRVAFDNFMECRLLRGQGEKGEWCRARGMRHQGRGRNKNLAVPSQPPAELDKSRN